jgi:hypothetical protein
LSNFVKQLFKAERDAETARRRPDTPAPRIVQAPPPPDDVTVAQMSPFASDPGVEVESVLLSLDASNVAKLQRLARQRSITTDALLHEMINGYLRYVD